MNFPRKINLGSGKDFREHYVNVDISDLWSPDVVADVSQRFPAGGRQEFETRRFGKIAIELGGFGKTSSYARPAPSTR